jgi:hypothetical protein
MDRDDPEKGIGLNSSDSAEIIIMHDFAGTHEYFAKIIEKFLEKGIQFVSPYDT